MVIDRPIELDKPIAKSDHGKSYRPPQSVLEVFWTLSDGNDEERNNGAIKLCKLVQQTDEEKEKGLILKYCRDRLIRGLSSGRKFARVGFSVALTQLLRNDEGLTTSEVLSSVKEKLKLAGLDKRSKAEIGGIFLGRAFAFSSIIQSGRIGKTSNEELIVILEELLAMSQRKSYLKPVCHNTIEDLLKQISVDTFGECVWPRLRDSMKLGWDGCTLDKLSLLLVCRDKFSDVVNKKFLKKHWGFPILAAENYEKLLRVILDTPMQRAEMFLKILPSLLQNDNTPLTVWQGLGESLMKQAQVKKTDSASQLQLVGLKLAAYLLNCTSDCDQVEELMLCSSLAHAVFHDITQKNDPIAAEANSLFEQFEAKVKSEELKVQPLIVRLWNLSAEESDSQPGRPDIIHSNNFTKLIDLMEKEEAAQFAETLIGAVKGTDQLIKLSSKEITRTKQIESCLRCLQHAVCSQSLSSIALQKSCLALFLRLSFFKVTKKTPDIQHCESIMNLEEGKPMKLCKTFLYKCLDHLCTTRGTSQSKSDHLEEYISVLLYLAHYLQSLMKSDKIVPIQSWPEQLTDEWNRVYKSVNKIEKTCKGKHSVKDSAFLLLYLYLAFHMLNDFKTSSDLLQEVYVCHTKASKQTKTRQDDDNEELPWQEVVTEVLLNLMSLQSHLGRVVSCSVMRLLSSHLTTNAVQLITEVLIPKSGRGDDAGGVLVEADDEEDNEEEDDDDESLIDEDIPEEESEEDDDDENEEVESDDDQDEDEEEGMQVDEKFRASVKEALGKAAAGDDSADEEDNNNEEELSDLSDTEMFKLDDMLAEVFRQKKKASTKKKNQEEKKKEMATFRIRVLDLLEVLVKSDRCGDFIPELMKPVLLLILKTDAKENLSMFEKSKSLFKLIKSKSKGLTDTIHTADEQSDFFQELLDLAQTVTDSSHVQEVSVACHVVMKLNCEHSKDQSKKCMKLIEEMVRNVITKGKSKLKPSFFSCLIENDVARYQFLSPMVVSFLKDPDVKLHGKMICCSMLSSLLKKTDRVEESVQDGSTDWVKELATLTSDIIKNLNTEDIKVMYIKELLTMACALVKHPVFTQPPFGEEETQHLMSIRPKLNSDLRRLANKFISIVKGCVSKSENPESNKQKKKKEKKPQQTTGDEVSENTVTDESTTSKKKKNKKRKLSQIDIEEDKTDENGKDEDTQLATTEINARKKGKNKKRKISETENPEEKIPPGKKAKL